MDKKPTPGYCPHCKTGLNSGATACTGCGAFETTAWDQLGVWKTSLLIACFLLAPVLAVMVAFASPKAALVVWLGAMVAYFVYRYRSKRKRVWAVGGRRII